MAASDEDFFGLADNAYWTASLGNDPAPLDRTLKRNFWGLALGAPRQVPLDARSTLPALVCQVETVATGRLRRLRRQGLVTAMNLRTGALRVTRFTDSAQEERPLDPEPPPEPGEEPPPDSSNDRISSLSTLDLRERLGLAWEPAEYLVTVILMDRVSNRVRVALAPTESSFLDPAVAEFIAAEYARLRPLPPAPPPGDPVPRYRAWDGAPEIPSEPGINLRADRVSAIREDRRAMLYGSFRVPLRPQNIVRPDPNNPDPDQLALYDGATAVVDIAVLLTGADAPSPVQLVLRVPSYDPIDPAAPPREVTGHFALDMLRTAGMPHVGQTYFIYAFSGELMAGPVPFALVPAAALPPVD